MIVSLMQVMLTLMTYLFSDLFDDFIIGCHNKSIIPFEFILPTSIRAGNVLEKLTQPLGVIDTIHIWSGC